MEFQNHGSEQDDGVLWIKNAPMYRAHTNEEIEWFINMCIFCDVSLSPTLHKMYNNINTHIQVRKKQGCL
jgi:hypothetical protein